MISKSRVGVGIAIAATLGIVSSIKAQDPATPSSGQVKRSIPGGRGGFFIFL
jgi:hypothetical protein